MMAARKKRPSALNGVIVSVPPTSQEILNVDLDLVKVVGLELELKEVVELRQPKVGMTKFVGLEKELAVPDPMMAALKKRPSALNGVTVSVPPTNQEILNVDLDLEVLEEVKILGQGTL